MKITNDRSSLTFSPKDEDKVVSIIMNARMLKMK